MVLTLLLGCEKDVTPAPKTILTGSIINPTDSLLTIVGSDHFRDTIKVDTNGKFRDTLDLMPGSYLLSYGKLFWRVYTENGYELDISFNTKRFNETLAYKGIGGNENTYVFAKLQKQRTEMGLREEAMNIINDSSLIQLETLREQALLFLEQNSTLLPSFKTLEKRNIGYGYLLDLKRLQKRDTIKNVTGLNKEIEVLERELTYDNAMDFLFSSSYRRLVEDYYRDLAKSSALANGRDQDIAYLQSILKNGNDTIKNSLAFDFAKYGITYTNDLEAFYELYVEIATNAHYKKVVAEDYEILRKVAKGAPSPNFENYENYLGGKTSLSDLEGSYLFIDVWATWCGPCRYEIPYLKKLEEKYHGKNIRFVSISIDRHKDCDKWKEMVKSKELGGVQLLADSDWESSFVKSYLIKGIPRFIILDPKGNIIDANSPTPSSGELEAIFDEFEL